MVAGLGATEKADRGLPLGDASQETRRRRNRLRLLLIVAVLVPIGFIAAQAVLSWKHVWSEAEKELSRTADAAAEYSLRLLETHRLALARVNDLLRGLSDDEMRRREGELHAQLRRLLPELPLVQTLAVNDRAGGVLLTANVYPVPRDVNVNDREWMRDLRTAEAPAIHVSRIYVGRLDRYLFFAVSRRRTETGNAVPGFDGVINISVEPNAFASGFAHQKPLPIGGRGVARASRDRDHAYVEKRLRNARFKFGRRLYLHCREFSVQPNIE